jgi:hypothetical protein
VTEHREIAFNRDDHVLRSTNVRSVRRSRPRVLFELLLFVDVRILDNVHCTNCRVVQSVQVRWKPCADDACGVGAVVQPLALMVDVLLDVLDAVETRTTLGA